MKKKYVLHHGDCLDHLEFMPDNSVDAIVTDPPAGIGFMGKEWDHHKGGRDQWVAWLSEIMRECLRVLKPGGHALVWAIPRTSHWTATAIEDAGFEVRDRVSHVFGSGFPKSMDVSKAIDKAIGAERERVPPRSVIGHQRNIGNRRPYMDDPNHTTVSDIPASAAAAAAWQGWGTALKPAMEDWWLARKPLIGTVAENVLSHGTGALNIDGCRISGVKGVPASGRTKPRDDGWGMKGNETTAGFDPNVGRWPANLIHDGSDEVVSAFPNAPGQQGDLNETGRERISKGRYGDMPPPVPHKARNDAGSAARFFYAAKASKKDRNDGVMELLTWESADLNQLTASLKELQKVMSDDMTLLLDAIEWNTSWCGKDITVRYQSAIRSIIKMMSRTTTESTTLNYSQHLSISDFIRAAIKTATETGSNLAELVEFTSRLKLNTTNERTASTHAVVLAALQTLSHTSRNAKQGNIHSTVKPTALMAYLCRLITPPNGIILDPFMGSGSTGKAALIEGFRFIGIEREKEYLDIAEARIRAALAEQDDEL